MKQSETQLFLDNSFKFNVGHSCLTCKCCVQFHLQKLSDFLVHDRFEVCKLCHKSLKHNFQNSSSSITYHLQQQNWSTWFNFITYLTYY